MSLALPLITLERIDPDDEENIIAGYDPRFILVEYGYFEEDTGEFLDVHLEIATGAYFGIQGYQSDGQAWIEEIIPMRRVMMHQPEYFPI